MGAICSYRLSCVSVPLDYISSQTFTSLAALRKSCWTSGCCEVPLGLGAARSDGGNSATSKVNLIEVKLTKKGKKTLTLDVADSGTGLPKELIERLTEPYVTTRRKGTGLGLAIVSKVVEDHAGELLLENRTGGGARVAMLFDLEALASRIKEKLAVQTQPSASGAPARSDGKEEISRGA